MHCVELAHKGLFISSLNCIRLTLILDICGNFEPSGKILKLGLTF